MTALQLGYAPPVFRPGEHYVPGRAGCPALCAQLPRRTVRFVASVAWRTEGGFAHRLVRMEAAPNESKAALRRVLRRDIRATFPDARDISFLIEREDEQ